MVQKPKLIYRFLKSVVNVLAVILIALFIDGLISAPIAKTTNIYKQTNEEFTSLKKEYQQYEDLYGIYTYDEQGNRIKVVGTDTTAFNNDPRVNEIVKLAKEDKKIINIINLVTFSSSYLVSVVILFILVPLFNKKHLNLGGILFHIVLTKDGEMMVKKRAFKYILINTGIYSILVPASFLLIGIADIILIFCPLYKQKSLLERIFKFDYSLDLDLLESEIPSEEKKFEDEHSYNDQTPRDIINLK